MSVNPNAAGAARAPSRLPRPRLTVVPRVARRAPRVPFLVLVVSVLAAGLVGLLLLNTSMERGAYQVTALRQQAAALTIQQQNLELEVSALQDPQVVAEKALRLGMVQNPSPLFLTLPTGKVIGRGPAATAADRPLIGLAAGSGTVRLAKTPPMAAGVGNGASSGVVAHRAPHVTKHGDTGAGSAAKRR